MKRFLVLLVSLMLVVPLLALAEESSNQVENPAGSPTNNLLVPVEPQEPQQNVLSQPEGQQQLTPQPAQPPQPAVNPGQPQNQLNGPGQNNLNNQPPGNKNQQLLPPNVGNQPGKYGPPPNVQSGVPQQFNPNQPGKEQQNPLPPPDGNGEQGEQNDPEQPKEIPETDGSWVPLKKIGNFFYFWKPKNAPKEEQPEGQQKQLQDMGDTKNNFKTPLKKSPQEAFKDGQRAPNGEEPNAGEESNQKSGNENFEDTYEKDKANTKIDVKAFKNPGEADTAFEKIFKEGSLEIVLVKNMKLVKRTGGDMDEYLWPAHDKIISLSVPKGNSLEQNLLVFEYLGKYPSKLNPNSNTLGLPGEGMNLPLKETPQFKEKESKGEQSGEFPAMQAGIPNGTDKGAGQQQFTPQAPPGCKVGDKGVPTGFRLLNEGSAQYCDMDEKLHPQKELEGSCQNNFECQSNQCSSGKCLDLNAKMEETQSLLQKILAWLGVKNE